MGPVKWSEERRVLCTRDFLNRVNERGGMAQVRRQRLSARQFLTVVTTICLLTSLTVQAYSAIDQRVSWKSEH